MLTNKKKKIVATLGPACDNKEIIKDMIDAGLMCLELIFSHADRSGARKRTKNDNSLSR
jgi:pyruvate kinase